MGNSKSLESVEDLCQRMIIGIKVKADHNKKEALSCFIITIFATLTSPLFITLGEGLILGKIVPSVLSLFAAGSTAWLQLRRPQQLWGLYRTAQRELEDQQTKHRYKILEYKTSPDPDELLAEKIAEIALNLHRQWVQMIPAPESLGAIERDKSIESKNH